MTGPGPTGRLRSRPVLVGLLCAGAALVVIHLAGYTELSPIDERQHVDYLVKASRFDPVGRGERIGAEAMREQACRGIDAPAAPDLRCDGGPYRPEDFGEGGYNTASVHPPTYYALTGWAARAVAAVTPADSLVTGGRLAGALWLAAGLALLWACLGELGIAVPTRAGVLLVAMSSPVVLFQSSTVTPDATALVAAGACLWAVLAWDRGRVAWWVPALTAVVPVLTKATNVVGLLAAVAFLAVRGVQRGSAPGEGRGRSPWWTAGAMLGAGGLAAGAWLVVASWLTVSDEVLPMTERLRVDRFPVGQLVVNVRGSPLMLDAVSSFSPTLLVALAAVVSVGVTVAAIASLALAGTTARQRAVAAGGLLALVAAGPLFVVVNYVVGGHVYVDVPGRYGLSAAPAVLAGGAVVLQRLRPAWLVPAAGAAVAVTTAVSLAVG